jgi:hypothetical protein
MQSTQSISAVMPGHYRKVKQSNETRLCELCRNQLSRYNQGKRCYAHKEPSWKPLPLS